MSGASRTGAGAAVRGRIARSDALRILAVGGAAGATWGLDAFRRSGPVERSRILMGSGVHLTVLGEDREAAAAAADASLAHMAGLEGLLSRYRTDSEVGRLNAGGKLAEASPALLDVLGLADRIHRLGDGILDPRTGTSAPELASATVVAPDAATADGLATRVMVLGPRRGRELLEDFSGCEGYLVGKDLEVVRTSRFAVA